MTGGPSRFSSTHVGAADPAVEHVTRSILIATDDEVARARLSSLLEQAGYPAVSVSSAREAREAAAAAFFPIVIVDRMLEAGDGLSLCADLRKCAHHGRMFLLVRSTSDCRFDIGEALRAGADACLSERSTEAELLAYIEAASTVARFVLR